MYKLVRDQTNKFILTLSYGVIGNTLDFESREFRFDP